MKKIYDLSIQNQMAEDRKILIANDGTQYDISFIPAIINRKYYKAYQELQLELIEIMPHFFRIRTQISEGIIVSAEDMKKAERFKEVSNELSNSAVDFIIAVLKFNGYNDITEEDLFVQFSDEGLSKSISYIMGLEDQDVKKK